MNLCAALWFAWKNACIDIKWRKCNFCLGFMSVFIVVWISLVINTVIEKGPIIFLKLAEGNSGEIDGIITSFQDSPTDIDDDATEPKNFLNYTRIQELNTEGEFLLAPWKNFKVLYYADFITLEDDGTPRLDTDTI